ncbi:hypothetical protein M9435_005231 [Picochlorum sp. BPE23]|nr:hypothetical protein M9435_005231 [Picochlorum sp. BPE23]
MRGVRRAMAALCVLSQTPTTIIQVDPTLEKKSEAKDSQAAVLHFVKNSYEDESVENGKGAVGWQVGRLAMDMARSAVLTTASCKARDNGDEKRNHVTKMYLEKVAKDIWSEMDEYIHRRASQLGSETLFNSKVDLPVVSVTGNRFKVSFYIPSVLDMRSIRRGVREAVRGSSQPSISLSEEQTTGPSGRASTVRIQSSSSGKMVISILEPFSRDEYATVEFEGDLQQSSVDIMSEAMRSVLRAGGGWRGNSFDRIPGGGRMWQMEDEMGSLEDMIRMFLEKGMMDVPFFQQDEEEMRRGAPPYQRHHSETESNQDGVAERLRSMGCQVFFPEVHSQENNGHTDWGQLAGYELQKKAIEENLLLPLKKPDVYDEVARKTREHYSSNRPRAVLFTGPPGCGKTSSARIIAKQASVPLVYIPLEALASKWYGESEKKLSEALKLTDELEEGAVLFLDELDSLATSRGSDMHEATRRTLGVLLRHLDGFDLSKRTVIIGATNRPEDLDAALQSRFSTTIHFGLPSEECRRGILKQYAKQLKEGEIKQLAAITQGLSGRDLRDICEVAERQWATMIIHGDAPSESLPPLDVYLTSVKARKESFM